MLIVREENSYLQVTVEKRLIEVAMQQMNPPQKLYAKGKAQVRDTSHG